jgi:hypothetical protein
VKNIARYARISLFVTHCCGSLSISGCGNDNDERPAVSTTTLAHSVQHPEKNRKKIIPLVECVADRGSDRVALFGYRNISNETIVVPPGHRNNVEPRVGAAELPSVFLPGEHRNVFSVAFSSKNLIWQIGGVVAHVDKRTPICPIAACVTSPDARAHGEQIEAAALAVAVATETLRNEVATEKEQLWANLEADGISADDFEARRGVLARKSLDLIELVNPQSGAAFAPATNGGTP